MKKLTTDLLKEETLKAVKEAKDDFGVEIDPNNIDCERMMRSIKQERSCLVKVLSAESTMVV